VEPVGADDLEAVVRYCYRHPKRETGLRCTRCERPACWECLRPAPVGSHCLDCIAEGARTQRRATLPWQERGGRSAVVAIVVLCVGGYLLQLASPAVTDRFAAQGTAIAGGQWYRLLTAMFLHAGTMHLGFNLIALWIFGREVEAREGPVRTALVFLVTGLAGGAAAFLFEPANALALGASGGVFGLLGVCLVRTWRSGASVQPLVVLLVINLAIGLAVPNISLADHVGGFGAGVVYGLPSLLHRRHRPDVLALCVLAALVVAAFAVVQTLAPGALA
jgi:membrane associated rhomboid family serine protease